MTETCNVCGGIYMYEISGYDGMWGNWNGGVCNTCKEREPGLCIWGTRLVDTTERMGDRDSGYRCSKCDPDHILNQLP